MRGSTIAAFLLLVCIAIARIVSTYGTFNGAYDEPWHIAAGMEPLQFGSYTYEQKHPPLSRLTLAIGPYVDGARAARHREGPLPDIFEDGNAILYSSGDYWRTLTLARLGALPFFVLLCGVTFLWARRYSVAAGWWALILSTCCAPILGHAGVAAIDLPGAAGMTLALYAFVCWRETPTTGRAAWLGLAIAFAFMTKLSSVAFLAAAFMLAIRRVPAWRQVAVAALTLFVALWACYGFSIHRLNEQWGPHPGIDRIEQEHPALRRVIEAAMATPIPLSQLILGVRDVTRHDGIGHDSFLLGKYRNTGWWYFFPVVLAVKTPLGLLLLALWGARGGKTVGWFFVAILAVCMVSNIDLGVRHILAVFPLLAILGGVAVANAGRWRPLAILLVLGVAVDSARAHPDYLAHFNELAGAHPENILAESDLDWGQDLARLSVRLKDLHADQVGIAYFGSALLDKVGLPPYHSLDPKRPSPGYVAISLHHLKITRAKDGSYAWLDAFTPRERIGKSIDLYFIP